MRLRNAIKMDAQAMDAQGSVPRWGIVTGANGATVKVLIQPEGVQSDWLPLLSSMVGGGWGLVHIPPNGTQVFLLPDAGDHESYVVAGSTWSTQALAPGAAQGEAWLVHSTGSLIKLTNDGKVTIRDAGGCSLVFSNNGTATLTGNLHVTGNVIAGFGTGDQVGLQTHRHGTGTNAAGTVAPTAGI